MKKRIILGIVLAVNFFNCCAMEKDDFQEKMIEGRKERAKQSYNNVCKHAKTQEDKDNLQSFEKTVFELFKEIDEIEQLEKANHSWFGDKDDEYC